MKIGIPATTDVDATVERCEQLGVNTVFVSCASLPGYEERGYPDANALRVLKEGLEQRGISVPSATYWFARWPDRPWRQGSTNPDILLTRDRTCIDAMKRMLERLGEVGITSVLHYVDLGRPLDPADEEACRDGLIAIYEEIIPEAEAHGIGIGNHSLHRLLADGVREKAIAEGVRIEDYDSYAAEGWGGPFLVGNWKELTRLVDAVPSPSNGVTLCTGMDIPGGDVPSLVRTFAGKIHFCQVRDHTDRWPAGREVLPGEGRVDLQAIVAALRDVGFTGIANPEHLGKPASPGEDRLAEAIPYVRSLLESTLDG